MFYLAIKEALFADNAESLLKYQWIEENILKNQQPPHELLEGNRDMTSKHLKHLLGQKGVYHSNPGLSPPQYT